MKRQRSQKSVLILGKGGIWMSDVVRKWGGRRHLDSTCSRSNAGIQEGNNSQKNYFRHKVGRPRRAMLIGPVTQSNTMNS